MNTDSLRVISGHLTGDAALDTATSRAILERVGSGDIPETLQVGVPHRVVAFGRQDALSPGFEHAVATATAHGFDATVRIAGGRAVVFHRLTVRFAWTLRDVEPARSMHDRFQILAETVVSTLATVGVSSEIGPLPREYCFGRYSVHLKDGGKVMGVGQRLSRNAAQVGGMIVVGDSHSINEVLIPIYRQLEVDFDPDATGSVHDVAAVDVATMSEGLVDAIADGRKLIHAAPDPDTITRAHELRSNHIPAPLA